MKEQLHIVVTGKIDAGKSTLIGRFLYETRSLSKGAIEEINHLCQQLKRDFEFAYLLDSFEEERRGQLTIDTTQVFCKRRRGRDFVFIDVPGHQELLKNMLCGSSYADIAILVIDAQKSMEEQTKRHAFILKFLGIEQIILVLNKMDSVNFNKVIFEESREKLNNFLKKIQFSPRYFIPVSAKQGENIIKKSDNMPWYKGESLLEALNACFKKKRNGSFRFPIQDIYSLNGEKVAVGRTISGRIKRGERVIILPVNEEAKLKAIRVFNKNKLFVEAPESVGLILDKMDSLRRGQVLCRPDLPQVKKEILAKLFCVSTLSLKENLQFRCATQMVCAEINQINGIWDTVNLELKSKENLLKDTDLAEVIIRTKEPVVVEKFKGRNNLGRFVLEKNKEISAIGIIL